MRRAADIQFQEHLHKLLGTGGGFGELALLATTDADARRLDGLSLQKYLLGDPRVDSTFVWQAWNDAVKAAQNGAGGAEVAPTASILLPDMPATVLDGRLGEICQRRLGDFALAYAWPALLAAASTLVRIPPELGKVFVNLYVALVGPVHTGKSEAIKRAAWLVDADAETTMFGSVEGLLEKLSGREGAVLWFPDELSHLLEKAQITNAAFAYVLNTLFYGNAVTITSTKRKVIDFRGPLSIVGGIVDKKFGDGFGAATTSGLYDRFLFGQCPSGFSYRYRPQEGQPELETNELAGGSDRSPVVPRIHPEVWEAKNQLVDDEKINPRLLELSIRAALICAAFDGKSELRVEDLKPAWELARYQQRARLLLKPNEGKTYDGIVAHNILSYLDAHPTGEKYLSLRDVLKATGSYGYGPSLAERVVDALAFSGEIELSETPAPRGPKKRLIRRLPEPEPEATV